MDKWDERMDQVRKGHYSGSFNMGETPRERKFVAISSILLIVGVWAIIIGGVIYFFTQI